MNQLNPKGLGLAAGVLLGAIWLALMLFSLLTGIGNLTIATIGAFHPFFSYSWGGMVVIVIEHLIGGYIIGWIFAKLYNKLAQ